MFFCWHNFVMKKICLILIFCCGVANANPMFGNKDKNSFGVYVAQSAGQGDLGYLIFPWEWDFGPMTFVMAQYSQPVEIFRLPARINFNVMQNFAYRGMDGTSFGAIGLSWDIALLHWCGWYMGLGIGPYMRDTGDRFVESRLVFGERVFIGREISDDWRVELFSQHFSNGDFTDINHGFNFLGLAVNYSF